MDQNLYRKDNAGTIIRSNRMQNQSNSSTGGARPSGIDDKSQQVNSSVIRLDLDY